MIAVAAPRPRIGLTDVEASRVTTNVYGYEAMRFLVAMEIYRLDHPPTDERES